MADLSPNPQHKPGSEEGTVASVDPISICAQSSQAHTPILRYKPGIEPDLCYSNSV